MRSTRNARRGVTLLESLIAVGLLVVVVTAVLSAMEVGRQQSDEGRRLTMSALAAEMLLARVADADANAFQEPQAWFRHFTNSSTNGGWNGHLEPAGSVRAGRDAVLPLLPEDYQEFQLLVETQRQVHRIDPPIAVEIEGVHVRVLATTGEGRALTTIERFLPLPQHLAEVTE